ncbi:MAG: flagellar hook-basal body complex protein FliE [Hyphomicrobiales bacterium]|nr:flagellar hook-basal body complex protein FliE [Hyphomicrobiales bacterium]
MTTPSIAAGAYASLARLADPSAALERAGDGGKSFGDKSFGDLLKHAVGSVLEAGRKSDAQSQAMVAGKSNIVDVVTAVSETEVAVEALVSVRDKMIAAYEEIMRMPI